MSKQTIQQREQETYKYVIEYKRISKILDTFFKSSIKDLPNYSEIREKAVKKILGK